GRAVRANLHVSTLRQIYGERRLVVEHVSPRSEARPRRTGRADVDAAAEHHDAHLALRTVDRHRLAIAQAVRREADVAPAGRSWRHFDDVATLAPRFHEQA